MIAFSQAPPMAVLVTNPGRVECPEYFAPVRWHDNCHAFITDLAESPEASDATIMHMAGHVSKQMR